MKVADFTNQDPRHFYPDYGSGSTQDQLNPSVSIVAWQPDSKPKDYGSSSFSSQDPLESGQMVRIRRAIRNLWDRIFNAYCDVVIFHPWKVLLSSLFLSSLLSSCALYIHYDTFDFDPSMGFETRGTPLATARLTLDAIKELPRKAENSTSRQNILVRFIREPTTEHPFLWTKSTTDDNLKDRELREQQIMNATLPSTLEPITVNYDDYGVDSEPQAEDMNDVCTQYSAFPYSYTDYMAKIILQVELEQLFTVSTFKSLCEVDRIVNETIRSTNYSVPNRVRHSFNLPLVGVCLNLSVSKDCSSINENTVIELRDKLTECRYEISRGDNSSAICSLPMMQMALNLLSPKDPSDPFVAVVLAIPQSSNKDSYLFFSLLLKTLENHFTGDATIRFRGAQFNVKPQAFQHAMFHDTKIAAISAFLVLLCFLLYSRSIVFTAIILAIILLSMGLGFLIYSMILGIDFFPFINLLVIVLMIAIGADDAFLLLVYFRKEVKQAMIKSEKSISDLDIHHFRCLRLSLKHSLSSMFVTSTTTAVAFLSNIMSDIIVLRCFGIYASLTCAVNYLLVILILPSTIVLTSTTRRKKIIPTVDVAPVFTKFVYRWRIVVVLVSAVITIAAAVIAFFEPGLQTPRYNPAKLLRNSDPYEWFDNNSHRFNFEWKRRLMFARYFIIGSNTVKEMSGLSPYSGGKYFPVGFEPTLQQMKNIQRDVWWTYNLVSGITGLNVNDFYTSRESKTRGCSSKLHYKKTKTTIRMKSFTSVVKQVMDIQYPEYESWISKFLNSDPFCIHDAKISWKCFADRAIVDFPSQFPLDEAVIPSDGPIFDTHMNLVGYFVSIPSNVTLSLDSQAITKTFEEIDNICEIFKNIIVFVSLLVVILCTRRLMLSTISIIVISAIIIWITATLVFFGWKLSVVESTIIVLTIGLSFDYTLHIAAGLRDRQTADVFQNIRDCFQTAGTACILGGVTSLLCGFPLLFSKTAAFQQVGSLLTALGPLSLAGAGLFFPALFALTSRRRQNITVLRF